MATKRFTGNALARAQVSTLTVAGTWATSDTATITINGKDLVLTVGAATGTTDVAAALKAMLAGDAAVGTETRSQTGDNVEEFAELTATVSGSVVTLTGPEDGTPFTVSASESTAGNGTVAAATPTSATGSNHWGDADNWDTGAVPVSGENEVQVVDLASGTASGGTFTLTYSGQTTAAIAWNATAAQVKTALEALSNIGVDDVSVTGTDIDSTGYTVTFQNDLGYQNVAQMTVDGSLLTGSTPVAQVTTTTAGSTGDDVYIENTDVDILYSLSQAGLALNSLNIAASYTGRIGLPDVNESGGYWEYRTKYLTLEAATTVRIGHGPGAGSPRLKLDLGAGKTTIIVEKTAAPAEQGLPALLIQASNSYSTLNATEGSIGAAVEAGQTSVLQTVRCGYETSQASDVSMRLGSGVTLTTVEQTGGDLEINSGFTTLTRTGGTCTLRGAGACTTINNHLGTLYDAHTGTITTLSVGSGAVYDLSRDLRPKTITNKVSLYRGAKFLDPHSRATLGAGFQTVQCSLDDVEVDLGPNRSYTVS